MRVTYQMNAFPERHISICDTDINIFTVFLLHLLNQCICLLLSVISHFKALISSSCLSSEFLGDERGIFRSVADNDICASFGKILGDCKTNSSFVSNDKHGFVGEFEGDGHDLLL